MKQQVNLYQAQVRRDQQPFSARRLAQSVLGVLALVALVTGLIEWDYRRQEAASAALAQQRSERQQEIARLEVQFPAPQEDPALKSKLAGMEQDLAAKQGFLAEFSADALGNRSGFGEAMAALGGRPTPGLWLQSFSFRGDGGIAFLGAAEHPRAVPDFVARLGAEPVFAGREFQTLRIERSEENPRYVNFSLQSREAGR